MSGEASSLDGSNCEAKDSLTQEQKDMIEHFHEIVGNLDYSESVRIMVENNWNLEQAVHKIMDIPETTADLLDAGIAFQRAVAPPLMSTVGTDGPRRRHVNLNTPVDVKPFNQRVIKYPSTAQYGWYWQILKYAWSPFQKIFELFLYLFSAFQPDPRLTIVDSGYDIQNFIQQLKTEVSPSVLPDFVSQPYGNCISDAKENLQYLVIYLHDNTTYCLTVVRNVLCSDEFKSLVRDENIILWGCSVKTPEGYRVSQLLRQYSYPFIGLIGMQSNHKLGLLLRIEGEIERSDLIKKLKTALRDFEAPIIAARADREERMKTQYLRRQQDMDYAESLRVDREKEEMLQAKKESEKQLEAQRRQEEQRIEKQKEEITRIRSALASKLPMETESTDNTILIRIQTPSGQQSCRFKVTDSLKMLYYVVKSQPSCPWNFQIISNFPKQEWPCTPCCPEYDNPEIIREPRPDFNDPPSFKEFGITTNVTVLVIDQEA